MQSEKRTYIRRQATIKTAIIFLITLTLIYLISLLTISSSIYLIMTFSLRIPHLLKQYLLFRLTVFGLARMRSRQHWRNHQVHAVYRLSSLEIIHISFSQMPQNWTRGFCQLPFLHSSKTYGKLWRNGQDQMARRDMETGIHPELDHTPVIG